MLGKYGRGGKLRARRGFTLVETLVSMTLIALMLGVAIVNLRAPRGRADSKAAAQILVSSLRQFRQTAMAQGRTVAVGFATNNGTLQHSQGYYQLVGETKPQVTQHTRFDSEYSGVAVFCGQYAGPTWTNALPAQLSTDGFVLSNWLAPYPQDHLIAFLPNGVAVSDLPLGDGAYRLVVAKSFSYSGSPATLGAAQDPVTVSVKPSGEVSSDALVSGATAVALTPGSAGDGALVPAVTSGGNHPPTLVTPFLKLNPDVNADALASLAPAGSTATVPPSGLLTFTVFAADPDGDQLWCKWTGPGSFSSADGTRMVWDEANKRWVAEWTWKVPPGAVATQQFALTCEVYDNRGGVTTPVDVGLTMPKPAIVSGQSILCAMLDGAYRWNWDGTGAIQVVASQDVGNKAITKARWSPDYSNIAVAAGNELYLVGPEGQNLQRLYSFTAPIDAVCWDRTGLLLYVLQGDKLTSLQPDPSSPGATDLLVGLGLIGPNTLNMHPTEKLLMTSDSSAAGALAIWLPSPANPGAPTTQRVVGSTDQVHSPVFDLTGSKIYYRCGEPAPKGLCSMRVSCNVDSATRKLTLTNTPSTILNGVGCGSGYTVSPDGLFIAGGLSSGAGGVGNGKHGGSDWLSICPVTATSLADAIDVTAVPPTTTRSVVDVDWGYY